MDNLSVVTTTRGDRSARPAAASPPARPAPGGAGGAASADEVANAEATTIVLARIGPAEVTRPAVRPARTARARAGATLAYRATARTATRTQTRLEPLGGRIERLLRERLGVTLRTPGRGGRIFLTLAGGAVSLLALSAVVLGIGGGPAALRPLSGPTTAAPATGPAAAAAAPHRTVTETPGVPITATRGYLLTSYAPGRGARSEVRAAPDELPVGRDYRHLPRRGDDHLLTAEIVFPLLPAPAACVRRVELRITLLRTDGAPTDEGPYPLAAYPSALTGLAVGTIPTTIPTLDLVANRPRGSLAWSRYGGPSPAGDATVPDDPTAPDDPTVPDALAAAGGPADAGDPPAAGAGAAPPAGPPAAPAQEISADVTELYQRWITGMPTAAGKVAVPPGTPLVLAVRPALTNVLGTWRHTYAGVATSTPPRLVWTRRVHCG